MLGGIGMPSSRALAIGAGAFATFLLVKNSMVITEAGMIYLIQNHLTGALDVYTDPGLHRRMPFFSPRAWPRAWPSTIAVSSMVWWPSISMSPVALIVRSKLAWLPC